METNHRLCINCKKPSYDHAWVTRKCGNGITYENLTATDAPAEAAAAERAAEGACMTRDAGMAVIVDSKTGEIVE